MSVPFVVTLLECWCVANKKDKNGMLIKPTLEN